VQEGPAEGVAAAQVAQAEGGDGQAGEGVRRLLLQGPERRGEGRRRVRGQMARPVGAHGAVVPAERHLHAVRRVDNAGPRGELHLLGELEGAPRHLPDLEVRSGRGERRALRVEGEPRERVRRRRVPRVRRCEDEELRQAHARRHLILVSVDALHRPEAHFREDAHRSEHVACGVVGHVTHVVPSVRARPLSDQVHALRLASVPEAHGAVLAARGQLAVAAVERRRGHDAPRRRHEGVLRRVPPRDDEVGQTLGEKGPLAQPAGECGRALAGSRSSRRGAGWSSRRGAGLEPVGRRARCARDVHNSGELYRETLLRHHLLGQRRRLRRLGPGEWL